MKEYGEWVSLERLADDLCVAPCTLRVYLAKRKMTTGRKFGRAWRFPIEEALREARQKRLGKFR